MDDKIPSSPRYSGQHWLVEFHQAIRLDDLAHIEHALSAAVKASGAKLLKLELHHFGEGMGVAGVALLAESHISIHTWPEHGYAALDIFMCGAHTHPQASLDVLLVELQPKSCEVKKFLRGYSVGLDEKN